MDDDGIWDSQDDCVGAYDECEVCNGPGPQILGIDTIIVYYDSLYAEAIDEWWVYELYSDTLLTYLCENPGCMDPTADNYDPYAIEEDGSCVYSWQVPFVISNQRLLIDGYTYDLVAIGDQCWFAENLRNEHYANGDAIPANLSVSEWAIQPLVLLLCTEKVKDATTFHLTSTHATLESWRNMAACTTGTPWTMRVACVRAVGTFLRTESGP